MKKLLLCVAVILTMTSTMGADFKFAVLGDSQFHNADVFENMIHEVDLLKPAFTVQVGDMILGMTYDHDAAHREWNRFKKQIEPLSMPFYPVPGNHDVCTPETEEVYGAVWGQDKYYYSFDYENNHFIVLNTDYKQQFNKIGDDQIEWLKEDLERAKDSDNIFMFLHRPIFLQAKDRQYDAGVTGKAGDGKGKVEQEILDGMSAWAKIHPILMGYPVKAVFAGHNHYYSQYKKDGIEYIIMNSSGNMRYYEEEIGLFHQFLIVSVQDDEYTTAVIKRNSVLAADFMPFEEVGRFPAYLITDKGFQIDDPSEKDIITDFSFGIWNGSGESRTYQVEWETPNKTIVVEPKEQTITIPAKSGKNIITKLKIPKGEYDEKELPFANIEVPYTTHNGKDIRMKAKHNLFVPKKSTAVYTDEAPVIDGKADDAVWDKADLITDFQLDKKGNLAEFQTYVKLLYDDENLYVSVRGEEPNPEKLLTGARGAIKFLWGDDDFELFFDTNRDLKTFFRMMTNSIGTTFSSTPKKGLYEATYTVKPYVGKDFWSAEYKIPFEEFDGLEKPSAGTKWGFNVRRHRQNPEKVQSDWSKMQNVPYEPYRFGVIEFK